MRVCYLLCVCACVKVSPILTAYSEPFTHPFGTSSLTAITADHKSMDLSGVIVQRCCFRFILFHFHPLLLLVMMVQVLKPATKGKRNWFGAPNID